MSMLLAFLAAAAAAPLPDNASTPLPQQIHALVSEDADCIVKNEHDAASGAILSNATDAELVRSYPQLVRETCVPMRLGDYIRVGLTPTQMRDAIAEALVRRDLSAVAPPVLDDVPGLSHWRVGEPPATDSAGRPLTGRKAEEMMTEYQQAQLVAYLSRYGECVVRVDPAAAKALLMTDEGTPAESAAFGNMSTALGTCVAEGRSLNFNKSSLRGSIAVNYYRLAAAARAEEHTSAGK